MARHSSRIVRQTTVKECLFGWLQLVVFRRKQQTPQSFRTIASFQQQFLIEELNGLLGNQDMNNFLQTTHSFIELKEMFYDWKLNMTDSFH